MKMNKSLGILLMLLSIVFYSCKKETITPITNSQNHSTDINLVFIDATTGNLLNKAIDIKVFGKDSDLITSNNHISTITGESTITASKHITLDDHFKVGVVIKCSGYINNIHFFTEKTNDTIALVHAVNHPEGVVGLIDESIVLVNNSTTSEITISTGINSTSNTHAKVIIPIGTKFMDKNGTILSGTIRTTFLHFDGNHPNTDFATPGGDSLLHFGKKQKMHSPVFISLEMEDLNGVKVKFFSKPIVLVKEISPTTIHQLTGNVIQAGDSAHSISFDKATGLPNYEGTYCFSKSSNSSNLEVRQKIYHLSYYKLRDYVDTSNLESILANLNRDTRTTTQSYTADEVARIVVLTKEQIIMQSYQSALDQTSQPILSVLSILG